MARVLVVDDNADVRSALRALLEDIGHDVLDATNGMEAVDRALTDSPDVILLDLRMPRFDGMETLRRLRTSGATSPIPVIVITATGGQGDMQTAVAHGVCGYITKPWKPGEVEAQVAWALNAAVRRKAGKPLPAAWAPIRRRLLIG